MALIDHDSQKGIPDIIIPCDSPSRARDFVISSLSNKSSLPAGFGDFRNTYSPSIRLDAGISIPLNWLADTIPRPGIGQFQVPHSHATRLEDFSLTHTCRTESLIFCGLSRSCFSLMNITSLLASHPTAATAAATVAVRSVTRPLLQDRFLPPLLLASSAAAATSGRRNCGTRKLTGYTKTSSRRSMSSTSKLSEKFKPARRVAGQKQDVWSIVNEAAAASPVQPIVNMGQGFL